MYNETHFENLKGFISVQEMNLARDGMKVKQLSRIVQDYAGECILTNILTDMTEHLEGVEVGVDGKQAEFYEDDSRFCLIAPLTPQLQHWQEQFYSGVNVSVGMLYTSRDETLPKGEQISVGINYTIGNYNLEELDLAGIERKVTRKHIEDSIRGDCEHCVIANVVSEMFNESFDVHVDLNSACLHQYGEIALQFHITDRLSAWMDCYDNENDVGTITLIIQRRIDDLKGVHYTLDYMESTPRQKELQSKLSELSELSSNLAIMTEYPYENEEAKLAKTETAYQDLYAEIVESFG
ncbi:hypothetical protein J5I95_18160 [Candidatus Poribacteria bacterium]|nr:hypothetical protein [Candidatus Poribacteria bacterium]